MGEAMQLDAKVITYNFHCLADGLIHRMLFINGWRELHRLQADGETYVKMQKKEIQIE